MTRYQRRHSGPNLSNGAILILGICGVAYIVFKIVSCQHAIKTISRYEMKEIKPEKAGDSTINDSTIKLIPAR